MQKITIFLIILFLSACGKTDKNTETAQDSASVIITEAESQPLTEAECWNLFDTFWIEFQKAILNDDTNKIKTMCEFDYENLKFLIEAYNNKKLLLKINKSNYYYFKREFKKYIKVHKWTSLCFEKVYINYLETDCFYNIKVGEWNDKNVFEIEIISGTEGDDGIGNLCSRFSFALRNKQYKFIKCIICNLDGMCPSIYN